MDKVKTSDLTIYWNNGSDWVKASTGGISTLEAPDAALNGVWWKLPAGTDYPDQALLIINDLPSIGHWSWEPAFDMPLTRFQELLQPFNGKFTRV